MKIRFVAFVASVAALALGGAWSVSAADTAPARTTTATPASTAPTTPAALPDKNAMRTDDLELARHVVNALNGDSQFARSHITVTAREGHVYLSGAVDDRALVERADQIASRIAGGSNWIHDQLTVGRG